MLKLGEKSIKSLYFGGKSYAKAYLGEKLVFNKIKKPYYCEVEYIESTGTQWIDTGIIGNSDTKAELALIITTQATGNVGVFGSRGNSANSNLLAIGYGTSSLASDFNNSSYSSYRASISYELDTKYICYTSKEKRFIKDENGIVLAENTTLCNDTISTSNLLLFAETGVALKQQGKMFYAKIWEDNILVRDFIPILDFNMKPCMYDKVSGKLFYNQGSGEFLYGREIHEVEYLESNGNQYIDTGVKVEANTILKATFSISSTSASLTYIGARDEANKRFQVVDSLGIGSGYYYKKSVYPVANKKYEVELNSNGILVLNGVKLSATSGNFSAVTSEKTIYLFNTNTYVTTSIGGACKFWKSQIIKDGVLVRDYIPAIDENGKGFMFDRVSRTIFDNMGSGEFLHGKVV